jgi:hypothetical protein
MKPRAIQHQHQGSKRVGPPVRKGCRNRMGFVLVWPMWFFLVAAIGTMIEFGAMVYSLACGDCTFRGTGSGGTF